MKLPFANAKVKVTMLKMSTMLRHQQQQRANEVSQQTRNASRRAVKALALPCNLAESILQQLAIKDLQWAMNAPRRSGKALALPCVITLISQMCNHSQVSILASQVLPTLRWWGWLGPGGAMSCCCVAAVDGGMTAPLEPLPEPATGMPTVLPVGATACWFVAGGGVGAGTGCTSASKTF